MTMINMHCESEKRRIPPILGWTGFNILLLQEKIPARSNIRYLPVANSNPTHLCTVNAVFFKSLAIADELETECIVLVSDLAFYAKVQQVCWNDAMYMQRTVVKLDESIPACHFSVSLESTLKIQVWLTSYLKSELWYKGHYLGL